MSQQCAICAHLQLPARATMSVLHVETALVALGAEREGEKATVAVAACPEHAVDVYRGRVPGVVMSWRFVAPPQPASIS